MNSIKNNVPLNNEIKKREWLSFLFVTFVFFPLLSVGIVAGYGFIVWILQMIYGPPGV